MAASIDVAAVQRRFNNGPDRWRRNTTDHRELGAASGFDCRSVDYHRFRVDDRPAVVRMESYENDFSDHDVRQSNGFYVSGIRQRPDVRSRQSNSLNRKTR
ncbi:hypothetical protein ACI65C_012668 [Semiaphis heraclei]